MARAPGNELHFALSRPVEGTEASLARHAHWRTPSSGDCWLQSAAGEAKEALLFQLSDHFVGPRVWCAIAGASSSWFARQQPERRLLEYVNKYTRTHRLTRTRCPFTGPMQLIGHFLHTIAREREKGRQRGRRRAWQLFDLDLISSN